MEEIVTVNLPVGTSDHTAYFLGWDAEADADGSPSALDLAFSSVVTVLGVLLFLEPREKPRTAKIIPSTATPEPA
ncbi:MAG: hypothetical protein ACREBQ_10580 [Nitrososphaerales archaeon]